MNNNTNLPSTIHSSWHKYLNPLFSLPSIVELQTNILPNLYTDFGYGAGTVRRFQPNPEDIFNVFKMPLNEIKVCILEQDVYSGLNQANGYAFAVNNEVRTPKSLAIIFHELEKEYPNCTDSKLDNSLPNKDLRLWIEQGVFLLNMGLRTKVG